MFVFIWRGYGSCFAGLRVVYFFTNRDRRCGGDVSVGVVGLDRNGSLLGRCMTRLHSMRIRGSHVHFHEGVREVKRVVTCRVDGTLACSMGRMRAPLKATATDARSSGVIVTAMFHTKLPLRANFLGVFSRTSGTFISTFHFCGSSRRHVMSIRVRCVTTPSLGSEALLLISPVLTANRDVRLT